MSKFIHFGLFDFDKEGNICGNDKVSVEVARSNYLYLICKYNQSLLQDKGMKVPEFFKEELPQVLEMVEEGTAYSFLKAKVASNCLSEVQDAFDNTRNEKELIEKLNEKTLIKDKEFAQKVGKGINNLQLAYIITATSGNVLKSIEENLNYNDQAQKSKLFKDVIKYNKMVPVAEQVQENKLTVEDTKKMVG